MMRYYLVTMNDPNKPLQTGPEGQLLLPEQELPEKSVFAYVGESPPKIDTQNWKMKEYDSMDEVKKASVVVYDV